MASGKPLVDRYVTRNFRSSEFRCRCRRKECDAVPMDPLFLAKLQALRDLLQRPLYILSGARCPHWNGISRGAPRSLHLMGKAVDFERSDEDDPKQIEAMAEKAGLGGVGIANTFFHVDDGPKGRRWTY
jgi:uncharacterized protein YcbK (DUF882 family)